MFFTDSEQCRMLRDVDQLVRPLWDEEQGITDSLVQSAQQARAANVDSPCSALLCCRVSIVGIPVSSPCEHLLVDSSIACRSVRDGPPPPGWCWTRTTIGERSLAVVQLDMEDSSCSSRAAQAPYRGPPLLICCGNNTGKACKKIGRQAVT